MQNYLTYDADAAMFQLVRTGNIEAWAKGHGYENVAVVTETDTCRSNSMGILAEKITSSQAREYEADYGTWWTM